MENNFSRFRIVADSAADLQSLNCVSFAAAALKVITEEKEYADVPGLDTAAMVQELKDYKGKSGSSCPNPEDWVAAFGDAEYIFCITLTSALSGSWNAARVAADLYEAEHPGRHVFLIDSLSAGPGEAILAEKLEELILSGRSYEEICTEITAYQKKTGLLFALESLKNFANNGRVSPAVARVVGLLGIRIVAKASTKGTLEPIDKCRSGKKAIESIVKQLHLCGFTGGRIRINHCLNESGAQALRSRILADFPEADVRIGQTGGVCSFYAEKGGILLAYETL